MEKRGAKISYQFEEKIKKRREIRESDYINSDLGGTKRKICRILILLPGKWHFALKLSV